MRTRNKQEYNPVAVIVAGLIWMAVMFFILALSVDLFMSTVFYKPFFGFLLAMFAFLISASAVRFIIRKSSDRSAIKRRRR